MKKYMQAVQDWGQRHTLLVWTIAFYIVLMAVGLYCLLADFSKVPEYVYSTF